VTIAIRPCNEAGWREIWHIFLKNGIDILHEALHDQDQLDPACELRFSAQPILRGRSGASMPDMGSACLSGDSRASMQVLGCFRFRGKKHVAALAAGRTWSRMTQAVCTRLGPNADKPHVDTSEVIAKCLSPRVAGCKAVRSVPGQIDRWLMAPSTTVSGEILIRRVASAISQFIAEGPTHSDRSGPLGFADLFGPAGASGIPGLRQRTTELMYVFLIRRRSKL
jgi:hypothetical protein